MFHPMHFIVSYSSSCITSFWLSFSSLELVHSRHLHCYVVYFPPNVEVPEPEEDELDDIDEKPNTVIKKPPPQQTAPGTANANGVAGDANRKTTATVNTLIGPPTVKVERADAEKANIALKLPCGGEFCVDALCIAFEADLWPAVPRRTGPSCDKRCLSFSDMATCALFFGNLSGII